MTKTPKWLPDGSGIDPLTLDPKTVVEVEWSNRNRTAVYHDEGGFKIGAGDVGNGNPYPLGDGRIVRVFADVTPPMPDSRVEILAEVLHDTAGGCHDPFGTCGSTSEHYRAVACAVLADLDAMGAGQ